MSWQLLIAIGVIMFSISVLLRRVLLRDLKVDQFAFAAVFQGFTGLFVLLFALAHGFVLPDIAANWPGMLLTIGLYASGAIVSTYTLQRVEASIFSVLFATSAIWTMIAQYVLFQSGVTRLQLLGIILVLASITILVERNHLKQNKGILLGLIMGMIYGFANVGWAHYAKQSDVASWNSFSFLGPALLIMALRPRSVPAIGQFLKGNLLRQMLIIGAVFAVSSLATLTSLSLGNVSVVSVLLQTNIIVTMLLGILLLGEKELLSRKIIAAVTCFVAVLFITL